MIFGTTTKEGDYVEGRLLECENGHIKVSITQPETYADSVLTKQMAEGLILQDTMQLASEALSELYKRCKNDEDSTEQCTIINRDKMAIVDALVNEWHCKKAVAERLAVGIVRGKTIPLTKAIGCCVQGFIDNCGVSAGFRTIYFDAGQALFDQYVLLDDEAEFAGCEFYDAMYKFNDNFNIEEHHKYDIACIDIGEYIDMTLDELDDRGETDEQAQALCYGIWLQLCDYYTI